MRRLTFAALLALLPVASALAADPQAMFAELVRAGLQALIEADGDESCVLVCTDHEEVGSTSMCGADGPFLEQVLRRLLPDEDDFQRAVSHSLLISADNAHAVHPNYADKHDGNHGPKLNAGPVIKINSNQRYATSSETAGFFRHLCLAEEVPVQSFVVRSDMGCGSTIGPITASQLGVRTVDIGLPTFAMHSIRELAGSHDLLVTIEENAVMGGAGSAVSEFLAAENLLKPLLHLGLPDYYVEHAKPSQMLAECGLDAAGIEAAVRKRLAALGKA